MYVFTFLKTIAIDRFSYSGSSHIFFICNYINLKTETSQKNFNYKYSSLFLFYLMSEEGDYGAIEKLVTRWKKNYWK